MKYVKMLRLLAGAATALMASTSPASAQLTEATGDRVEAGDVIHATAINTIQLDGAVNVSCVDSTFTGVVNAPGGTSFNLTTLTFSDCKGATVSTISGGALSIHSSGAVNSTGVEVTLKLHRSVLGFPITTHCTYETNNTAVGNLTESDSSGHPTATLDIDSAQILIDPATF